jgi:hypothetical protein
MLKWLNKIRQLENKFGPNAKPRGTALIVALGGKCPCQSIVYLHEPTQHNYLKLTIWKIRTSTGKMKTLNFKNTNQIFNHRPQLHSENTCCKKLIPKLTSWTELKRKTTIPEPNNYLVETSPLYGHHPRKTLKYADISREKPHTTAQHAVQMNHCE